MEKIALNSTENSDNTDSAYKVNFQPNLLCLVQLRKNMCKVKFFHHANTKTKIPICQQC